MSHLSSRTQHCCRFNISFSASDFIDLISPEFMYILEHSIVCDWLTVAYKDTKRLITYYHTHKPFQHVWWLIHCSIKLIFHRKVELELIFYFSFRYFNNSSAARCVRESVDGGKLFFFIYLLWLILVLWKGKKTT